MGEESREKARADADCQEQLASGQCNCGQVMFSIESLVTDLYVCHCSLCRRATGAIGVVVAIVPSGQFRWIAGEGLIRQWRMPGHDWECSFCENCGSHLPGKNDAASMYVPAGSLNAGTERLRVRHHIWVSSKARWHEIGDDALQHPEGLNVT